ncbi:hypothetical protein K1719_035545 [Acacia pycnantha]|nr:hypothetical protein K1719_035545 [Acacia pycnantha]
MTIKRKGMTFEIPHIVSCELEIADNVDNIFVWIFQVAIVTGGAGGIGAESVRLFAQNGASVVIADVQDEPGHQLAASLAPHHVSYHHCDVRDEKQVEQTIAFAVDTYGRLDVMFSNAGIAGSMAGLLDLDLSAFDNTMAVHVRGVVATIKRAARAMVAGNIRGSIICTASVAASVAGCAPYDYTTAKHALVGLVRSTCSELGAYGIRVNCVSPYATSDRQDTQPNRRLSTPAR